MVLLIAGIGLLLAGLLTVGVGIELDLSFGNTLILAGAVVACTGVVTIGLWMVVRELKNIARRLGPGIAVETRRGQQSALPAPASQAPQDDGFPFGDQPMGQEPAEAAPWQEQATTRGRSEPTVAPEPAVKPRRNLLFSATSRKERERAQAARTDSFAADMERAPFVPPPDPEPEEAPPATFDDAWPKPERIRPADAPAGRGSRAPAEQNIAMAPDRAPRPARNEAGPEVTVLKSGVVDGMAYSLYSDGSIEAQLPEGMMRFASIDELRAHLDQRL
jgi:hypothetical protein